MIGEPETLFGADGWLAERPRDNRFDPVELRPRDRASVVREEGGRRRDAVVARGMAASDYGE